MKPRVTVILELSNHTDVYWDLGCTKIYALGIHVYHIVYSPHRYIFNYLLTYNLR